MAQVTLNVNNHSYRVVCRDGQEGRLKELAGLIDAKAAEVAAALGRGVSEEKLILMASLVLVDELSDGQTLSEIAQESAADGGGEAGAGINLVPVIETLNEAAEKVETIAARLEKS